MVMAGLAAIVPVGTTVTDQFFQLETILDLFAQELQDLGTGRRPGAHVAAGEGAWGAFTRLV